MIDDAAAGRNPVNRPRLRIGIIGPGRVGCALGELAHRAGHQIVGVVSRRPDRLEIYRERLGDAVEILTLPVLAERCDFLLLTVPDPQLPRVVKHLARHIRPGQIAVHCSGAGSVTLLDPLAERGAITCAIHPIMTFLGHSLDVVHLRDARYGISGADLRAEAVAEVFVGELGGVAVRIPDAQRVLYHAAIAHGANHLITLVNQSLAALEALGVGPPGTAEEMLTPILRAALDNTMSDGSLALTGPMVRGDLVTVSRHTRALTAVDESIGATYRALAEATGRLKPRGTV